MNLACRSCSSKRILRGVRVVSRGLFSDRVTVEIPGSEGLNRHVRNTVSAHVCVDCGHLELHASDLMELQRAYASLGEPLGLGSREANGPVGS
jgi:hypothetical protein